MNKDIKFKMWIIGYLGIVFGILCIIGIKVAEVDPFFHYHEPNTQSYYYSLDNERSQNDGITKHFEYDALITGTSMTQNFKKSEMDDFFGTNSVKVCYAGGTFKEINDNLRVALANNSKLKIIVRGLDMSKFIEDKDAMRNDLGEFPTYLYDDNVFNDVEYLYNRNVIFERVFPMIKNSDKEDIGIDSFDQYSNWMKWYKFGINTLKPQGINETKPGKAIHLTEEEKQIVIGTVEQNIVLGQRRIRR